VIEGVPHLASSLVAGPELGDASTGATEEVAPPPPKPSSRAPKPKPSSQAAPPAASSRSLPVDQGAPAADRAAADRAAKAATEQVERQRMTAANAKRKVEQWEAKLVSVQESLVAARSASTKADRRLAEAMEAEKAARAGQPAAAAPGSPHRGSKKESDAQRRSPRSRLRELEKLEGHLSPAEFALKRQKIVDSI